MNHIASEPSGLERAAYWTVYSFILALWATVGCAVWLVMVARVGSVFVFSVFVRLVSSSSTEGIKKELDYTIHFWMVGFRKIFDIIRNISDTETEVPPLKWGRFSAELISFLSVLVTLKVIVPISKNAANVYISDHHLESQVVMSMICASLAFILVVIWGSTIAIRTLKEEIKK